MKIDRVKDYLNKFKTIGFLPSWLREVEYFDPEFVNQVQEFKSLSHYQYDNPIQSITLYDNGTYGIYTSMALMSVETSLEDYIQKCEDSKNQIKEKIEVQGFKF